MLGTASLVFVVLRLTGDPAMMVAPPGATLDDLAAIRRDLGLDRSIAAQYVEFLSKLAVGDLAESFRYRRPALEIVTERPLEAWVAPTNLGSMRVNERPLVLGVSRKSFIGKVLGSAAMEDRSWPTVALTSAPATKPRSSTRTAATARPQISSARGSGRNDST